MIRHWWEGTNYSIEELCVSPEFRGRGLDTRFMGMIEEDIISRGLSGIFLPITKTGHPLGCPVISVFSALGTGE